MRRGVSVLGGGVALQGEFGLVGGEGYAIREVIVTIGRRSWRQHGCVQRSDWTNWRMWS